MVSATNKKPRTWMGRLRHPLRAGIATTAVLGAMALSLLPSEVTFPGPEVWMVLGSVLFLLIMGYSALVTSVHGAKSTQ